jgi:choline dehydrogenase-like flavoprotein
MTTQAMTTQAMTTQAMATGYDSIVIGSGAGGAACAYALTRAGRRVLLLERGERLPKDGSTLAADQVLKHGRFKDGEPWQDRTGQAIAPSEFPNLGGKTKWYGAALLRFPPEHFAAEEGHECRGWPIDYQALEPFYAQAEALMQVRPFAPEPDMQRIAARLVAHDRGWRYAPLPLGLAAGILDDRAEADHFDGYASVHGLKSDADVALLARVLDAPNLRLRTGCPVETLIGAPGEPARVQGVVLAGGERLVAGQVVLAAGALHSPRILARYLEAQGLARALPCADQVGRCYKAHFNTAVLAFNLHVQTDVLRKTLLLTHGSLPHSTVQALGGNIAADIFEAEAPALLPRALARGGGRHLYGFFLTSEDGSHPDNRVRAGNGGAPCLDYDPARLPVSHGEHRALVRRFLRALLRQGYLGVAKAMPVESTAHACGTLGAGADPRGSVVDGDGRVHGMQGLYVADGSVFARSSRVNPALTIYAWGLRLGGHLAGAGPAH